MKRLYKDQEKEMRKVKVNIKKLHTVSLSAVIKSGKHLRFKRLTFYIALFFQF